MVTFVTDLQSLAAASLCFLANIVWFPGSQDKYFSKYFIQTNFILTGNHYQQLYGLLFLLCVTIQTITMTCLTIHT